MHHAIEVIDMRQRDNHEAIGKQLTYSQSMLSEKIKGQQSYFEEKFAELEELVTAHKRQLTSENTKLQNQSRQHTKDLDNVASKIAKHQDLTHKQLEQEKLNMFKMVEKLKTDLLE